MTLPFKEINFSINLLESAQCELQFLEKVDKLKYLYDPNVIKESIRRYETLWLPLVANCTDPIAAPIDIYWVWHVHMLSPVAYKTDMENMFGKIIDHKFLSDELYESSLRKLEQIWKSNHVSEPFQLTNFSGKSKFVSRFSYDIESAACRQSSFYYQVSLPHFKSRHFLQKSIDRYRMFIALKRKYPNKFIVPCYDIDIVWHSHQIHPLSYESDCQALLGKLLPHDDSYNDRSPNSKLIKSEKVTRDLWFDSFRESFTNSGCMFRGETSQGQLVTMPEQHVTAILSKTVDLTIDIATEKTDVWNYKLKLYVVCDSWTESCIYCYDYASRKTTKKKLVRFSTTKNRGFRLKLIEKRKGAFQAKKILSNYFISTAENFDNLYEESAKIVMKCEIWDVSCRLIIDLLINY